MMYERPEQSDLERLAAHAAGWHDGLVRGAMLRNAGVAQLAAGGVVPPAARHAAGRPRTLALGERDLEEGELEANAGVVARPRSGTPDSYWRFQREPRAIADLCARFGPPSADPSWRS